MELIKENFRQSIFHEYNKTHFLLKIKIKDLLDMTIVNWEHNRPPDMFRCDEIVKQFMATSKYTDWMFYMIYENNSYKMIDGIHRLTALNILRAQQEKNLMENNGMIDTHYDELLNKIIIISLRIHPTMGEIIDLYQSINKSVSIPNIYFNVSFENKEKRIVLEDTVKYWMKRFPSHFTSSNRPNIPNTNRDNFIELLDNIYDNISIKTKETLIDKLNEMNEYIKENPISYKKNLENSIKKCQQTGCWLFLIRTQYLQEIY